MSIRKACGDLSVSRATFYRHGKAKESFCGPRKPKTVPRALSPQERKTVRATLYSERFADSSVREVHATLLEEGIYLASVRTMYRILGKDGATAERRDQLRHPSYAKPELLGPGFSRSGLGKSRGLLRPGSACHLAGSYVLLDIFRLPIFQQERGASLDLSTFQKLVSKILTHSGIPRWLCRIGRIRGRYVLWRCGSYGTSPVPKALGEGLFPSYFL